MVSNKGKIVAVIIGKINKGRAVQGTRIRDILTARVIHQISRTKIPVIGFCIPRMVFNGYTFIDTNGVGYRKISLSKHNRNRKSGNQ